MISLISLSEAAAFIKWDYGLQGELNPLDGEFDQNIFLSTPSGGQYVIKIAQDHIAREFLEYQNAMIEHLANCDGLTIPESIANKEGSKISIIHDSRGVRHFVRILTWIPGRLWKNVCPISSDLLFQLGQTSAAYAKALLNFDHPQAHRFLKWNISRGDWIFSHRQIFDGNPRQSMIESGMEKLKSRLQKIEGLRQSVIYNDANDHNILVSDDLINPVVVGFIDFGDAIHSNLINDLAITCTYGAMDRVDPLESMAQIVRGFNEVLPLLEEEINALYDLITGRLCISLTVSELNKKEHPENVYLQVSQEQAWNLLGKWHLIPADFAESVFRHACGLEPCDLKKDFENSLAEKKVNYGLPLEISAQEILPLDLSVESPSFGAAANLLDRQKRNQLLMGMLKDVKGAVAYWGSVELCDSDPEFGNDGYRWRALSTGDQYWFRDRIEVLCPYPGKVIHIVKQDLPEIWIEHNAEGISFYSIFRNLEDGPDSPAMNTDLAAGSRIGYPAEEYGLYHFSIQLSLKYLPGFLTLHSPDHWNDVYKSLCPDPGLFEEVRSKSVPKGESGNYLLQMRRRILGRSLSISYDSPLHIVRGHMQYLIDAAGRRYLDTVNNVAHVGHEHPSVVEAGKRQMSLLNTNTRYLHDEILRFADELLDRCPSNLSVIHFVNSGSEANELALRMVRTFTGQRDMIAIEGAYHGNTQACIDVSSYKFLGPGGAGLPEYTQIIPLPDTYRGIYRGTRAAWQYAAHTKEAIVAIRKKNRGLGGFIFESVMSCAGQIVLPEGYLRDVFRLVRAEGGICIADEVQVGLGRIGSGFWGFEHHGVVPDIITVGKPLGNGHPVAAVICTKEIAEAFDNGMEYFNTFGGNPVSCAIGRQVLNVISDEHLQENAKLAGEYLINQLQNLKNDFPVIGDVRGLGLFLGFEIVDDPQERIPGKQKARYLKERMRECGVLMSTDGPDENVLKIKPPMCFGTHDSDHLCNFLRQILKEDHMQVC